MQKLMIRVLEKILGSFCIFFGGAGGGMICFVPQMGQTSTHDRNIWYICQVELISI